MLVTEKYNPLGWFLIVYMINTIVGGIVFWINSPYDDVYGIISRADYIVVNLLSIIAILPFYVSRKIYAARFDIHFETKDWQKHRTLSVLLLLIGFYLSIQFGNDVTALGYLELADVRLRGDKIIENWGLKYQLFQGIATYIYIKLIIARLRSRDKQLTFMVVCFMIMFLCIGTIAVHKQDLIFPVLLPMVISITFSVSNGKGIMFSKVILSLSVLLIVYFLSTGRSSFYFLLSEAGSRLLTGQVGPLFLWYDYFSANEILWGTSLPNPGGLFPFESVNIAAYLMENYFSSKGSIPVAFWGYIFADFGYIGVIIVPIIMLIYLLVILKIASKIIFGLEYLAFYVYVGLKLLFLAFGSYALLLYDFTLPFILLVLFILKTLKHVWYSRNNIN